MIYEAVSSETSPSSVVFHEPRSVDFYFSRGIGGTFLTAVGFFVILFFVSGGIGTPLGHGIRFVAGWIVLLFMFVSLGVIPLSLGVAELTVTQRMLCDRETRVLALQSFFCGLLVVNRKYDIPVFDTIRVTRELVGGLVKQPCLAIYAEGKARKTGLVAYRDFAQARNMASEISTIAGLPLQIENVQGQPSQSGLES